ncbi:MAG: radical SAM protein [Desulfomonilaceae bacterium]
MRVLLISPNREEINMVTWPLGLACVAAATQKAGHDVKLLDLMETNDAAGALKEAIAALHPDVIGISVRNIDDQTMEPPQFLLEEVKEFIDVCRNLSNAPIVLGGAGYSIFPESALEFLGANIGIQGEGEVAFPELLTRMEQGRDLSGVPGLYLYKAGPRGKRELSKDLDEFPLPGSHLLSAARYSDKQFWLPVQTRRGCPMNCSYCSTAVIEGCITRKRSPKVVVQWLNEWVRIGLKQFYFVDNTFNLPPSYARMLCSELVEAGLDIAWRCILYPVRISEQLISLMAASGCAEVSLGFESGHELILHGMNKHFKPDDVRHTSGLLGKHGIRRMGFLLLGGPGETKESALESLEFADSLHLEAMKVSVGIRIYPYTVLADVARKEGVISPDDNLLFPRFYVVQGLEDWLRETVKDWAAHRPSWMG